MSPGLSYIADTNDMPVKDGQKLDEDEQKHGSECKNVLLVLQVVSSGRECRSSHANRQCLSRRHRHEPEIQSRTVTTDTQPASDYHVFRFVF